MTYTYQLKYIRCGKKTCRTCPHGPYWYRFWKERGRLRCEYVGKVDPSFHEQLLYGNERAELDEIFDKGKASAELAERILGVRKGCDVAHAQKAYREKCLECHPDRGGDKRAFQRLNAAWSFLKVARGWK
jgi:DnaJ domain